MCAALGKDFACLCGLVRLVLYSSCYCVVAYFGFARWSDEWNISVDVLAAFVAIDCCSAMRYHMIYSAWLGCDERDALAGG